MRSIAGILRSHEIEEQFGVEQAQGRMLKNYSKNKGGMSEKKGGKKNWEWRNPYE